MPDAVPAGTAPSNAIAALADQCVMCGLCLPHCPTYRVDPVEAESPRGRIALARAVATGHLTATATAMAHLDHCLACLSCQQVCPSKVHYEDLLVQTRGLLADAPRAPAALPKPLRRLLRTPRSATAAARWGARLRLGRWLPRLARGLPPGSLWRRLAEAQPELPAPAPRVPATRGAPSRGAPTRGTIALFSGCVASVYDRDTLAAATRLLEALGYAVISTPGGACCGALERHHGNLAGAARSASSTRAAIEATGADTVLVAASGCHSDLRRQAMAGSLVRVQDVLAFVARDEAIGALRFRAAPLRVALHLPCSQVNSVGSLDAIHTLLARVPGLSVNVLPEQPRCCGAAGSYFLEEPRIAARLREEKLSQAEALAPELLLTTNIGCRIHLANGLRERRSPVRVLHPLALLAERLDNSSP